MCKHNLFNNLAFLLRGKMPPLSYINSLHTVEGFTSKDRSFQKKKQFCPKTTTQKTWLRLQPAWPALQDLDSRQPHRFIILFISRSNPGPASSNYCNFIVHVHIQESKTLSFFFKSFLALLEPLLFQVNFRIKSALLQAYTFCLSFSIQSIPLRPLLYAGHCI